MSIRGYGVPDRAHGACHRAALRADPLARLSGTTWVNAFADFNFQTFVIASASEAIHRTANSRLDCFVAFRLRSLSYGGQVAPRNDDSSRYASAHPAARCVRVVATAALVNRGRTVFRALDAPAASPAITKANEHDHHSPTGFIR